MTIRTYLTEDEKQLVFLALPAYAEKHEETMLLPGLVLTSWNAGRTVSAVE